MAKVEDVLKVLRSQIGYHEKNDDTDLDSFTSSTDGKGNHTKYARDLYQAGFFGGSDKCGYDWCSVFTTWVGYKVTGSKDDAMTFLCQLRPYGAGCVYAREDYQTSGRLYSTPQVGDQVFFANTKNDPDHTGFVESVGSDGDFTTIEGNWSNQVMRVSHNLTNDSEWHYIDFGRPRYEDVTSSSTETVEPVKTQNNTIYTVVSGDTLSEIAERFGTTVDRIVSDNGILDRNMIYVGQELSINTGSTSAQSTTDNLGDLEVGDEVSMKTDAPVYGSETKFHSWVYDCRLYVRAIDGDMITVSIYRDGALTGNVDRKYLTKA